MMNDAFPLLKTVRLVTKKNVVNPTGRGFRVKRGRARVSTEGWFPRWGNHPGFSSDKMHVF